MDITYITPWIDTREWEVHPQLVSIKIYNRKSGKWEILWMHHTLRSY